MNDERNNELALPAGFKAAGMHAGIKKKHKKDLMLLVSNVPAAVAGTFTTNQVKAAPVKLCQKRLGGGRAQAVIVNSGIANACTGEQGLKDADRMTALTAELLGIDKEMVFVCSTGGIGKPLPMHVIEQGIAKITKVASEKGAADAAEAILTTDTRPKHCTVHVEVDGKPVTITGLAKGAGMIEPNMATMLAFIMTDAAVERAALQACLAEAVAGSFNRITVDGDRSTNDTVLCMANGEAGNRPLAPDHDGWQVFEAALTEVCEDLALKIVEDGEGVTKRVTIHVAGAASDAEAEVAARAVANSLLVKTSWVGQHANWGRVMDALGYSAATVKEEHIDIAYDGVPAVKDGQAASTPAEEVDAVVAREAFTVKIDLHLGDGEAVVYTCDCTEEYVRINM